MAETDTIKDKARTPRREGFINSIWADITGAAITIATGLVAANHSINKAFYQNIKIAPAVGGKVDANGKNGHMAESPVEQAYAKIHQEPLLVESKKETQRIYTEVEHMTGSAAEKRKYLITEANAYSKKFNKQFDALLAEKYGIENVWHRFQMLRPHQKFEVSTKVGTAVAVTLGAVATVAALRSIANEQQDFEARLAAMEVTHQRKL